MDNNAKNTSSKKQGKSSVSNNNSDYDVDYKNSSSLDSSSSKSASNKTSNNSVSNYRHEPMVETPNPKAAQNKSPSSGNIRGI